MESLGGISVRATVHSAYDRKRSTIYLRTRFDSPDKSGGKNKKFVLFSVEETVGGIEPEPME